MKAQAFLLLAVLFGAFLAANFFALQPGVGGRRNKTPGIELERYFGWPAVWRAELWDSDDPALAGRVRKRVPFYWPQGEMELRHRYVGKAAIAVDVGLLFSCCGGIIAYNLKVIGPSWRLGLGAFCVAGLLACFLLAQAVSVYL